MLPLWFIYPYIFRKPKYRKRMDNCPRCIDFNKNAEQYATNKISKEITVLANEYANKKVECIKMNYIDHYMLHYRIEYTRLYNSRIQEAKESYNAVLDTLYINNPNLCPFCIKENDHSVFNQQISFCFHEKDYDDTCENCIKKMKITDPFAHF